ncbi:MAG: hypothetical protein Q8K87_01710, partial [Hydrogenophaga sp.]|nr:hypothetical protein [Hydrogenophaga sp.]
SSSVRLCTPSQLASAAYPRVMGAAEVQQFLTTLTTLTTECNISVSTHNQAHSDLLFLSRQPQPG